MSAAICLNVVDRRVPLALGELGFAGAEPRGVVIDVLLPRLLDHFLETLLRLREAPELGQRRGEAEARRDAGVAIGVGVRGAL